MILSASRKGVKTGQFFSTTPPISTSRKSRDREDNLGALGARGGLDAGALKHRRGSLQLSRSQ